jgi:hypothetical protein
MKLENRYQDFCKYQIEVKRGATPWPWDYDYQWKTLFQPAQPEWLIDVLRGEI